MGVPVVALRGRTHAGRMTASVLTAIGMPELAADNPEGYIRAAAALAADLPRLGELRGSLRGRMSAAPLCDGAAFTRGLEHAYRAMWRRRCAPRG
jgi:predicted O-linked N-acetylglucosamine transferase (SPINDLY family)